ncbi:HU family DNA-binding protein [Clostridium sp. ZBS18]|uniref:HU family DNA-binding protein n=1 Tax=Clostridium sp. ZBS18 TaxID=2949967 RepID=UPI002079E047|nr:HU family DNA-binding protein [Clostridium sp. ZBS18]
MKKEQLLELLISKFEEVTTKKDAETMLKVVDDVIEVVSESLGEDKNVTVGKYIKIENKLIGARSGVSKIGGVEKPWDKPEHREIKIKNTKALNR